MTTTSLVVIGAGPAGVAAALEARRHGADVTLVAEQPIGGRGGWTSLVPAKAFLSLAAARREAPRATVGEMTRVSAALLRIADRHNGHLAEELARAGVRFEQGLARFLGEKRVEVARPGELPLLIDFDQAILATGSLPIVPRDCIPDGRRVLEPKHLSALDSMPETMLVVGGGVTGTEMAYAFSAFGAEVTWLVDEHGVLPTFDAEVRDPLVARFAQRGVRLVTGHRTAAIVEHGDGVRATLADGSHHDARAAFVTIGRQPDLDRLQLDTIGLSRQGATGGLRVDADARTAIAHVFAVGDATGRPFMASKANAQAWTAARAAMGAAHPPLLQRAWIEAAHSVPQVAHVGLSLREAREHPTQHHVRTVYYREVLQGHLLEVADLPPEEAALHLVSDAESDVVLGATAIGPDAATMLHPVVVALRVGLTVHQLAASFPATPSVGDLLALAARPGT
jgi:dihydrolipoamide dehydrogenase